MAFINIYKLSDYIKDKTDALLARYGHVNALAEIISPNINIYNLESSTASNITVYQNAKAGIIKNININALTTIKLINSKVNENSVIFYKLVPTERAELTQLKCDLVMLRNTALFEPKTLLFLINAILPNRITGDIHYWIVN